MLAFVDMETTGLNANEEVPLEVGICLTGDFGELIAEKSWLIYEVSPLYRDRIRAAKQHKIVGPMHEKSGLWIALSNSDACFTRAEADQAINQWLWDQKVPFSEIPMTGNSIGSLDRPFAQVHFPLFNKYLSYRNVDMSSIKEICKRVNPILFENLRPVVEDKESAVHRVLEDNHAAIRQYKAYIDNFLIVGD